MFGCQHSKLLTSYHYVVYVQKATQYVLCADKKEEECSLESNSSFKGVISPFN